MTTTAPKTDMRRHPVAEQCSRRTRPVWELPALILLLASTATLYLWRLSESGWANSFYSAAVQAGAQSWKAFFFGSFDSSNFITVDKPPASLWVMELSVRVFGLNSWSILVPQALEGVAAVGLLYATVRRYAGPAAGLIAGATLALTPVAVLMFRFNNPDALLTLLLVAATYTMLRALEAASTPWLVATGVLIGTAFLTKMAQALIIVPVLALAYLMIAPTPLRRRLVQLLAAGGALVVAAGWWVAIVQLTPASDRPYIGGSQDNSLLNLIFGYNGLGRLTGNETGSVGGGPAGAGGRWGATGFTRLFGSEMGTQISWLLPAALILTAGVLWSTRHRPRTDLSRAATLIFAGWLVLTGLVFSYAQGIIHPYYTVVLAPPIGGLIGIGSVRLWQLRRHRWARTSLAAATLSTALWAFELLGRTPTYDPWLRELVLAVGLLAALGLAGAAVGARATRAAAGLAALAAIAAPAAYALTTASMPHSGAIPSAGPSGSGVPGFAGALGGGAAGGTPPSGSLPGGGRTGSAPPAARPSSDGAGATGMGGLLNASAPSAALTRVLESKASRYRWIAAAVGSNVAAGYQLATKDPVMAIGGFNGSDPTPTLAQFERYVREGDVHYFIAAGAGTAGPSAGGGAASQISSWVKAHYSAKEVGGMTLYDLS